MLRAVQWITVRALLILMSTIIALVVIEGSLMVSGVEPLSAVISGYRVIENELICQPETGCVFNADVITANCNPRYPTQGNGFTRNCVMNDAGYPDRDPFLPINPDQVPHRVLALGDSFTFGFTASIGNSWMELVQERVESSDVIVWNAATPGTGVAQQQLTLAKLAPMLQPTLVILGLNENDLPDALWPIDAWVPVVHDERGHKWVRKYSLSETFEPTLRSEQSLFYAAEDIDLQGLAAWQVDLLRTRVGTVLLLAAPFLKTSHEIQPLWQSPGWDHLGNDRVKAELTDFVQQVETLDATLLILNISTTYTVENYPNNSGEYRIADSRHILNALGLPFVSVSEALTSEDYRNPNPADEHWNDSGHAKAGAVMADCVAYLIANNYSICPQVTHEQP